MHHSKKAHLFAVLSPLMLIAVSACASNAARAVVALPNGYYLQRDRTSQVELVNGSGHVIVAGPIAGYAVSREIVTGCVGKDLRKAGSYPNDSPLGELPDARCFVLDSRTGKITAGLSAADWKSQLKGLDPAVPAQIWAPVLPE